MSFPLREYQRECIDYFHQQWGAGLTRVPGVLATGLGKTVIFTHPDFVEPTLSAGRRVLIIAHTDELIEQAARKARAANPLRRVGVVKAERNETSANIIVSSRQTLASAKRRAQIRNVGLLIIDECHHCLKSNSYGKILEHFGAFDERPSVRVAGFTATLARGDKSKLSTVWEQPDRLFTRDILFGIRHGYLLDVRGMRVEVPDFDMGRVRQTAGDYRDGDLAEELERTYAPEIVAKKYLEAAGERKGIAFWPTVDTAYHGAKAFNELGIVSEVIHGNLPKMERRLLLKRLHASDTQVVHGVAVLTEGFDEPTVDVVVIGRPTRSAPLYQQMVGRVLRPDLELAPSDRGAALILDVVGAGAKHDLRSLIDLAPERALKEQSEDVSLLELDEWLIEEEEQRRAGASFEFECDPYAGDTELVAFDPLGRDRLWSRTPAGTWYVGAGGDAFAFLADSVEGDPGTYDVVLASKFSYTRGGVTPWARGTDYVGLPLDEALMWAESVAEELGGLGTKTLTGRKSAWRRREPSEKTLRLAKGLGISVVPGWNAGQVSEAIDAKYAERRLDPLVAMVKGAER